MSILAARCSGDACFSKASETITLQNASARQVFKMFTITLQFLLDKFYGFVVISFTIVEIGFLFLRIHSNFIL